MNERSVPFCQGVVASEQDEQTSIEGESLEANRLAGPGPSWLATRVNTKGLGSWSGKDPPRAVAQPVQV